MNISELTKEEKYSLLSTLLNDPDTIAISEAELQNRLRKVIEHLYDEIEKIILDYNRIRSEERKNGFSTLLDGWVAQGRAEACARIKTVLDEIVEKPELKQDSYDIISGLHEIKNKIIDNSFSNSLRITNKEMYERALRFEGKIAGILESEWTWAFNLGLECKDKVSEERLAEIRKLERRVSDDISSGIYGRKATIKDLLERIVFANTKIEIQNA